VYWAIGAGISGCIWGAAGIIMFVPDSPDHQALLMVALFGVTTGALMLIATHKPSFYAFVLPTLMPLIARMAIEGDALHLWMAAVAFLVLLAVLTFGTALNRVLTQSLSMRYENIELIAELTEQRRVAEQARQEAEKATRAKSQFLAAASHDLRQPLHAMGLFAAALSEINRTPEELDLVLSINASVVALEVLFNELLDISKLDSGVVKPNLYSREIQLLLDRLRVDYEQEAATKGIALRVRPCRAVVSSDHVLLERILRNLVSNAIRYTHSGGVLVGCRPRNGKLRIEVRDSGVGIPVHEQERIFEEFYQIGDSARHSKKGLGLGLAIIRRLCGLLGYHVDLRSAPGRGSMFAVTVPLGTLEPQRLQSSQSEKRAAAEFSGKVVLVVDDEQAILDATKALLSHWGCAVVAATTTDEALDGLGQLARAPDLIIADYRLQQGATGVDTIRRIREELGAAIPAIVITGSAAPELSLDAERYNFTLVNKPVIADALRELMFAKLGRA
jgi:signal transduction histidine kinase/CheY-like chemotaxis protein